MMRRMLAAWRTRRCQHDWEWTLTSDDTSRPGFDGITECCTACGAIGREWVTYQPHPLGTLAAPPRLHPLR